MKRETEERGGRLEDRAYGGVAIDGGLRLRDGIINPVTSLFRGKKVVKYICEDHRDRGEGGTRGKTKGDTIVGPEKRLRFLN